MMYELKTVIDRVCCIYENFFIFIVALNLQHILFTTWKVTFNINSNDLKLNILSVES